MLLYNFVQLCREKPTCNMRIYLLQETQIFPANNILINIPDIFEDENV